MGKGSEMYQCQIHYCGYVYDPEVGDQKVGVKPGTQFSDLPDDWKCPFCGAGKHLFKPLTGPGSVLWENVHKNPSMEGMTVEEVEARIAKGEAYLESPDAERAKVGEAREPGRGTGERPSY